MLNKTISISRINRCIVVLSYVLSILIAFFVFLAGGAPSAFANLMYIPIAVISSSRGKVQGLFHAFFSGLLLGPLMPLDIVSGTEQGTINWIIRLSIYMIISIIIGLFSEYNRQNKKYISNLLTHDLVTDLKNIEAIKREEEHNKSPKTVIAVSVKIYEEILSFFGYNFTNGVILKFSQVLRSTLSIYKKVELYRYDGMEFIIIVTHEDKEIDIGRIKNSLDSINKSTIRVDDIPIYIEIVMGITDIKAGESVLEGVRQALVSLRYAKENRSKLVVFNDELDDHFKNIVSIASKFKNALSKGNIKVAYQNIYSTSSGKVHGSELLTRWIVDDKVVFSPGEFISIIEKTELINDLSKYMIDNAIIKLMKEEGTNSIVSLNLSPSDFKDEVVDYLIMKIEKNRINPRQLQLEITEDVLIKKDEIIGYLNEIRNHGISIAIDDFGAGYSSYQYLSELPIDVVKIDRSLIIKIDTNPKSKGLVKSIVDFCKNNNIKTVAEGVESLEIVTVCRDLGIDFVQGFYYHKPTIIN